MRLVRASIRKLARRPAAWRTVAVVFGILALVYLSIGSSVKQLPPQQTAGIEQILVFPGAYSGVATFLLSFGSLATAAFAGLVAGAEWSWGTLRVAIARGESRARYVLGTFTALVVLVAAATFVLFVAGVALTLVADAIGGVNGGDPAEPAGLGRVPALVIGLAVALASATAIGFTLSFLLRNPIAGVVGVVALSIGEQLLAADIPADLRQYGPTASATALVTEAGTHGFGGDWFVYLGVNLAYAAVVLGVAILFARRAEIQ